MNLFDTVAEVLSKAVTDQDNPDDSVDTSAVVADTDGSGDKSPQGGVLMCCGNGDTLGNFELFAQDLKKDLVATYQAENIQIQKTVTKTALLEAIGSSTLEEIDQLHIFSHSIGAGLYLGYHLHEFSAARGGFLQQYPNPTYEQVVDFEPSALLTDHLLFATQLRPGVRSRLASCKLIKLWGCNAGVSGHPYDDSDPYWGALNTKNVPKPSIAQAIADFTGCNTYGALSGSHVEYRIKGRWVSGYDISGTPKGYDRIRLHPDHGDYKLFKPQGK